MIPRFGRGFSVAAATCLAWAAAVPAGDRDHPPVEVPKSLFISPAALAGVPDDEIRQWFDHIRAHHRRAGSPQRIDSLVLSEVADENPAGEGGAARLFATPPPGADPAGYHPANRKLDVVAPRFGDFDSVYVGTVHIPWKGPGNAYDKGIRDEPFRRRNLRASADAMDRFMATYPGRDFRWYISYEANLNYFVDPGIKDAFVSYGRELCAQMRARRDAAILWSPNFWTKYDSVAADARLSLVANLRDYFAKVPVTEVHFQDFMGGSSASGPGRFAADDVRRYYRMLADLGGPAARVNAELFIVTDLKTHSLAAMSPADYARRMRDYADLGLPLGASWEIRYWYRAHQGAGVCPGELP